MALEIAFLFFFERLALCKYERGAFIGFVLSSALDLVALGIDFPPLSLYVLVQEDRTIRAPPLTINFDLLYGMRVRKPLKEWLPGQHMHVGTHTHCIFFKPQIWLFGLMKVFSPHICKFPNRESCTGKTIKLF